MIDIEQYIPQLLVLLKERFGSRLIYVGVQGSYLRGEATDDSDIKTLSSVAFLFIRVLY